MKMLQLSIYVEEKSIFFIPFTRYGTFVRFETFECCLKFFFKRGFVELG